MSFRKYDHVERFGTDEVEGIEIGDVLVFPKLDGTNASIWRSQPYIVGTGSRNRTLSDESDNAGFHAWVQKQQWIRDFFEEYPFFNIYGEWLVPHTLKTYRDEAWGKFWVFDVWNKEEGRYVHYDAYAPEFEKRGFNVIEPKVRYTSPPTEAQLLVDAATNTYLMQDGSIGEGIVIKNYAWTNKYGRQPWAKIVRNEFKEENRRAFGTTEKVGEKSVEGEIAEKYVTKALVDKVLEKIKYELLNEAVKEGEYIDGANTLHGAAYDTRAAHLMHSKRGKAIPRLLQTVFYDLVREESWNFVKEWNNPVIDYKKLKNYTIYWVKKHHPELF